MDEVFKAYDVALLHHALHGVGLQHQVVVNGDSPRVLPPRAVLVAGAAAVGGVPDGGTLRLAAQLHRCAAAHGGAADARGRRHLHLHHRAVHLRGVALYGQRVAHDGELLLEVALHLQTGIALHAAAHGEHHLVTLSQRREVGGEGQEGHLRCQSYAWLLVTLVGVQQLQGAP